MDNLFIIVSSHANQQKSQHTPYEDFAKSAWLSPFRLALLNLEALPVLWRHLFPNSPF
jgi:hypothetical protein